MKNALASIVLFFLCSSISAYSEPYILNTGERLIDSEYVTIHTLFGKSRLVLKVQFEPGEVDKELRNLSFLEILIEHLLPSASRSGQERVSIWERHAERKVGPETGSFSLTLSASSYENYDFDLGKNWIWDQTSGPDLDLEAVSFREYNYDTDLNAYISGPFERPIEQWKYFEIWAVVEDASPEEAKEKANEIFRYFSGCSRDGVPIEADSFLGKRDAISFRVHMVPHVTSSPLQHQPRLKVTYGHEDHVAHCYTVNYDVSDSWDGLYKQLKEN